MTHSSPGTIAKSSGLTRSQMKRISPTGSHAAAAGWPTPQAAHNAADMHRTFNILTLSPIRFNRGTAPTR